MSDYLASGRLEDHPFPDLAGRIFRESRTGALTLEGGGHRRTVWFLGGNPSAVVSDDPQDHLARFLLEHGRVSENEHARLAALPETREAFAGADFLSKESLNWGVKFRFVNLCYDLFRWEQGDYSFAEGTPPAELFLLKVPAHSLILKGVGYLGRARLLDLVPDNAVLEAGEVPPEQARYLGPVERGVLEACHPGASVAGVLSAEGGDDPEQTRALVYALACLGLTAVSPAAAAAGTSAPQETAAPFALDEPEREPGEAFSFPAAPGRGDSDLTLPPLDDGAPEAPAADLASALEAAGTGGGAFSFDEGTADAGLGSFDDSFSAEAVEQQAAPGRKPAPAARRKAPRPSRGLRLPRLVGYVLGSLAACAIIGGALWWWLGAAEPPPPPPIKPFAKKPVPQPAPPAASLPLAPQGQPAAPPAPATAALPAAPASAQPPAPPPVPAAPAIPRTAPAPLPPQGQPATTSDRYRNGLDVFRAGDLDGAAAIWEDVLRLEHRDDFTLLLLTACQRETIREAQTTLAARRLYLVAKQVQGRSCFRVCVDTFGSRDAAQRALGELPGEFRAAGAAVRPVADVLKRDR